MVAGTNPLNIYPGNDGVVRVVTIETAEGQKKRAVRLFCPKPIENEEYKKTNVYFKF